MVLKYLLLALLVSVAYVHSEAPAEGEGETDDPDVFVLTAENFEEKIKGDEFVFVEFYAPWCGHCKKLVPEYAALATSLKGEGSKIVIAKLDATTANDVSVKYSIRGYPTLKLFRNGEPIDFEGGRTTSEMKVWLEKKTGPASKHLTSQQEIDDFKAQSGTRVLGFVGSGEEDDDEWMKAAASGSMDEFSFAHVTDSKLYGGKKANNFVIFKSDGDEVDFDGDEFSKSKIASFVETEGHPLVDELAQKSWQRSQSSNLPLFAGFHGAVEDKENLQIFSRLAKKFKGQVVFTYSATPSLAERWGASGKVIPTAVFVSWVDGDPKMTVFDEENEKFSEETAESFIQQCLKGEYKGYRKSDPIPEKNDEPVTILVGKNFDSIVMDKSKDVFVEFYAPWCGHCKKLSPIWDELGEVYEDDKNIVIGKMDATTNTPPDSVSIKGFPTLIFFPADNKDTPVPYNGERDLDNLVKFVKEQASHTVKGGDEKIDL